MRLINFDHNEYLPMLADSATVDTKMRNTIVAVTTDRVGIVAGGSKENEELMAATTNLDQKIENYHRFGERVYATEDLRDAADRATTTELTSFVKRVSDKLYNYVSDANTRSLPLLKLMDAQTILMEKRAYGLSVTSIDKATFRGVDGTGCAPYKAVNIRNNIYNKIADAYTKFSTVVYEPVTHVDDYGSTLSSIFTSLNASKLYGVVDSIQDLGIAVAHTLLCEHESANMTLGELGYSPNDVTRFADQYDKIRTKLYTAFELLFAANENDHGVSRFKRLLHSIRSIQQPEDQVLPAEAAAMRIKRMQMLIELNTNYAQIMLIKDMENLNRLFKLMVDMPQQHQLARQRS